MSLTRIAHITDQAVMVLSKFSYRPVNLTLDVIPADLTYATTQRGQEYLAEETLCIDKSATLTFSSGVASEPAGFFRMNYITLDSSIIRGAIEIDITEKDRLSKTLSNNDSEEIDANPRQNYFYRYGGSIYTWPALDDGSYEVHYWGRPTTTVDENTNPETPPYMDTALIYWTVKELAPVVRQPELGGQYEEMFEVELAEIMSKQSRTITHDMTIT